METFKNSQLERPNDSQENFGQESSSSAFLTEDEIQKKLDILANPIKSCDELQGENSIQFENKITYISAGAIGVILAFANPQFICPCLLVIGLILLLSACILNLSLYAWINYILDKEYRLFKEISYGLKSMKDSGYNKSYYEKHQKIINYTRAEFLDFIIKTINNRNKWAQIWNFINMILLIVGLIYVSIYVVVNLLK